MNVNRFACIQTYAATHMQGKTEIYVFTMQPPTWTHTHTPANNHTVVSLLLIFLTAVAFMHFQVIIGCLQPPHIMELCITSLFSFSLFLSRGNVAEIKQYLKMQTNSQKYKCSDTRMHLVPVQHNKPSLNLNWEDLQPERSVINAKHIYI